jgi:hypothetical protein
MQSGNQSHRDTGAASSGGREDAAAEQWFVRLFGLAALAHIVGNPHLRLDLAAVAFLLLGLAAIRLMLTPTDRFALIGAAVLVPVTAWIEAPRLGNHWLVMAFVAMTILVSQSSAGWWTRFVPAGRWILLVFYSFAAFAKLNEGFFDTDVSCGVFYAEQGLASWGFNGVVLPAGVGLAVAVLTAAIELSVPILLAITRTRHWGVLLGYTFHFAITFDLNQHFYDFTSVLFMLFILFIPTTAARLERHVAAAMSPVRQIVVAGAAFVFVVASIMPLSRLTFEILTDGFFVVWIPAGLALWAGTVRHRAPAPGVELGLRLLHPTAAVLVALVLFNGLTPYLEIKTGFGFNMYANLITANGESNHFLVPGTAQLTDGNADPITIIDTDDPDLALYIQQGYTPTKDRLADYLADHPEVSITYAIGDDDGVYRATGAEFGERLNPLLDRLWVFRSLDARPGNPRCQAIWLPAL